MNTTISVVLDICVLLFASVGFFTTVGILCLIIYQRHRYPINTPLVLMCNTYASIMWICLILVDMYGHNLYGDLHPNSSFDDGWCQGRAYLLHSGIALLYYSYLLQAIFRFFRVVLFNHKQLQTFRCIFLLIVLQWLISFLSTVPLLVLHHFQHIPLYFYCEILLSDNQGILLVGMFGYQPPMITIGLIYVYILHYMKQGASHSMLQNRKRSNRRDVSVLRRILILIGLLVTLAFPTSVLWMDYLRTGYVYPFGYHIGWFTFSLSLSILPVLSVFLTPQLHESFSVAWRRTRRIEPITLIHVREAQITVTQQRLPTN